jgi:hypothetical protein
LSTALVIHGHFYQPPRENPWTGEVDRELGAEPYHDWNERIYHECYRPNAYARIFDDHGRVSRIINNYSYLSYNFGPTLMSWMQRQHPLTYARILEADRDSAKKHGGHGNAIAQAYNHAILPLLNERDRLTQVRWGKIDFRWRFGRHAEAMWAPETAVDDRTLQTLIDEEMKFLILAPGQAKRWRRIGEDVWHDVHGNLDTGVPYRWFSRDGSRRHLDIFFYDGHLSRGIAFSGLLSSSRTMIETFGRARGGDGRIVHAATDGESYGHHFKFGDRCLAHALEFEAPRHGFWVTNYGAFLEKHPPQYEVEISHGADGLGSSWSCSHGIGRWYTDCGCHTGGGEGWNQKWRAPVRRALDLVRNAAVSAFESLGGELFADVWAARNAYVEVLLDPASRDQFLDRFARRKLDDAARVRALTLLEMQKNALLMYTSCGWFFSDVSGIETVQIMKYAGRVLDRMEELGVAAPRDAMLDAFAEARSNKPEAGTGADIYRKQVEGVRVGPRRVAAHLTIASLVDGADERGTIAGYNFQRRSFQRKHDGRIKLATGVVALTDHATTSVTELAVAAMHFGGVDFYCLVKGSPGPEALSASVKRLWGAFPAASLPSMLRTAQEEFGPEEYGLEHVLPGGRELVSRIVFGDLVVQFSEQYARLYEENRRTLEMLQAAGFELPKELRAAAEFTLGRRFEEEIASQHQSQDPAAYRRALEIAHEVASHGYQIDRTVSGQIFADMLDSRVLAATTRLRPDDVEAAIQLVQLVRKLGVDVKMDSAQEAVFEALARPADKRAREMLAPLAVVLGVALS